MSEQRWAWLREQTPVLRHYAYMNSGWSGPLSTPVVEAMHRRLELELEHGLTPETFRVRTRSDGLHIFLRVSEEVGNANKFPDGIDVRGGGGYVVGPGCFVPVQQHEQGERDQPDTNPALTHGITSPATLPSRSRPASGDTVSSAATGYDPHPSDD